MVELGFRSDYDVIERKKRKLNIVISACLLGEACRYDSKGNLSPAVRALAEMEGVNLIPVCPEVQGGLATPRPPSEIRYWTDDSCESVSEPQRTLEKRVINCEGIDVTQAFVMGAQKALRDAQNAGATIAILKAKSPSCGSGVVYDGTFSGTLTSGWGIAAELFAEQGIAVVDESEAAEILAAVREKSESMWENLVQESFEDIAKSRRGGPTHSNAQSTEMPSKPSSSATENSESAVMQEGTLVSNKGVSPDELPEESDSNSNAMPERDSATLANQSPDSAADPSPNPSPAHAEKLPPVTLRNAAKHFRTITKHKIEVAKLCFKIGLVKQGLTHDLSKYSPTEFLMGARFYQGFRSPNAAEREFRGYTEAWLHHKGRNRHHFEYWLDLSDDPGMRLKPAPMPTRYVLEMLCDRIAASKTYKGAEYSDADPLAYYERSKGHVIMHPETRALLEKLLVALAEEGEQAVIKLAKEIAKSGK